VGALRNAPAAVAPVVPLALGGRVSSTGSLKDEGAAPASREVLSEEQVHLVLHVARQAQDTKTPKCGAARTHALARTRLYTQNTGQRPRLPHTRLTSRLLSFRARDRVVEASLDLLQRLVAHGLLTGAADALPPSAGSDGGAAPDADDGDAGAPEAVSHGSTVAGAAVELMCRGYELADDAVELQLLKGLLTAISCATFQVHGEALLRCVRTCYNIFLGSKSEVNQTTAKATLTQALTIVFHRMEADSSLVPPPAITVTDLLYPGGTEEGASAMAQFVQGFVNRVFSDLSGWAPSAAAGGVPSEGVLLSERDGAFHSEEEEEEGASALPGGGSGGGTHAARNRSSASLTDADGSAGNTGDDGGGDSFVAVASSVERGSEEERLSLASAALRRDAFLVFRALCKLSMKSAPEGASGAADLFATRGKILSLELLKILLANAGPVFRASPKFAHAIKTHLCRSLLKNCASGLPAAFQLSCSIFIRLLERFRQHLKAEIGIFTDVIFLKALEVPPGGGGAPYYQRVTVLRCLGHQCRDAQLMVDLFVNYDCDLNSSNLYEKLVGVLLHTVREGAGPDVEKGVITPGQDAAMRVAATRALTDLTAALAKWIDKDSAAAAAARAAAAAAEEAAVAAAEAAAEGKLAEVVAGSERGSGGAPLSEAERFEQAKTNKVLFKEGLELFNKKPKKGIQFLQKAGQLPEDAAEVAHFLRTTPGLDKTQIGELLGSPDEADLRVMHAYVDSMDFPGMELDEAIRAFLNGFRLPGEAQKIDRLMEKFAERFCRANPASFKNADTAYVLAYSVIMLNTDAHNPGVKQKMSKAEFVKNNRGIDDGSDVPEPYMSALYDRITRNEIKMKDAPSHLDAAGDKRGATGGAAPASKGVADELTKVFLNLIPGRKAAAAAVDPAEAIMQAVRDRELAASDFFSAEDAGNVRPMWAATWEALLKIVSAAFEAAEDKATVMQCLDFLKQGVHLGASLGLDAPRDAFVQALARHTLLSAPAAMRAKHVEALRALVAAAETDANNLGGAWVHVLRAVSRYEHLHHLGSGFNDASLFNPDAAAADAAAMAAAEKARSAKGGAFGALKLRTGLGLTAAAATPKKKPTGGSGASSAPSPGGGDGDDGGDLIPPPKWVLDAVSPEELSSKVFLRTHLLESEAVVSFLRALCDVSLEELESRNPRVYSLAKIVEIAHFNMDRIRLVWSRIWAVLAEFFVTVGLLKNLSVAMYVVDSLRQLSMKFLARDELANYSFQNDFLRPYVVVMRNSTEVPIRELIIRCMSQMVAARVGNIKSGWKSMFMVFTTAANDTQRSIVVLAFETIERIMRQHFNHIVETESSAFTDCVNCLVAFTNSRCSPDVSLNAIAFLRFCALKLAEGALGNLDAAQSAAAVEAGGAVAALPAPAAAAGGASPSPSPLSRSSVSGGRSSVTFFTDADAHLYFWFPLLAGLSELTFDSRRDVRHSALEVLFDTLKFHGSAFSTAFWGRVFDKILFPIFDHVRAEGLASEQPAQQQQQQQQAAAAPAAALAAAPTSGDAPATPAPAGASAVPGAPLSASPPSSSPSGRGPDVPCDEVDAWLFETCTHCLHLIVDLYAQFFEQVAPLLGRLLALLTSLSLRPHEQLAACGVAALSRLADAAGPLFAAEQWEAYIDTLDAAMAAALPQLRRLGADAAAVAAGGDAGAPAPAAGTAWLRAAAEARGLGVTQLLLVHAVERLALSHAGDLSGTQLRRLLDLLQRAHRSAADANADAPLRASLRAAAASAASAAGADAPPALRLAAVLADPPLLQLEVDAGQAHLRALAHVSGGAAGPCRLDAAMAEERLATLIAEVLAAARAAQAAPREEAALRAPLAQAALEALSVGFTEAAFLRRVAVLFPACLDLVRADGVPAAVRAALADTLERRVLPVLRRAEGDT
jgi:brefeldin A-inhibited guanine nucleotide-exchange protein